MENQVTKKKICVLGAGAAGLCAARHLAQDSNAFEFTVFEKTSTVGGTWVYTDKVGLDDYGFPIHSSMYKYLRTNLPKEIMCFPDFREIKGSDQSCVSHDVILNYLKDYAEHFKLLQFIQFNTVVECIKPKLVNSEAAEKWQVRIKHLQSLETKELVFDAVLICNGHNFDPYIPNIPGLNNYHGQVLHSHAYRRPEEFTGKSVILLGASSSGIDISFELIGKVSQIYLSHNNERLSKNNDLTGITEVCGIDRFENGKFVLKDNLIISSDVLIFCTGYNYTYPFLDESCNITIDQKFVAPLYRHMINVEHPTMCFIGIPMTIVPFPLFHIQVQYMLSILKGKYHLPSKQIMTEDAKLKTPNKKYAHKLASAQWLYNDKLARAGGFEPLPIYYKIGYEAWTSLKNRKLGDYKNWNLLVTADAKSINIVKFKN